MNLNEIVLGENRALLPNIIEEIQNVALRSSLENEYITRRELVKELNSKISGLNLTDGLIINSLVKETYLQTPSQEVRNAVAVSFHDNTMSKPVYDPNNLSDVSLSLNYSGDVALNLNEFREITEIIDRKIETVGVNDAIAEFTEMKNAIELYVPKQNFSLTGKTKVKDNLNYGQKILKGYANLVGNYNCAKYQNHLLIEDFKFLRSELGRFRNDVIELLLDLIGEDKKEAYPELFDFSKIDYLETDKIMKDIDLEFVKLNDSFEIFQEAYDTSMINIQEAGQRHAEIALDKYSKSVKRKGYVSRAEVKGQVATAALGFAFDAALEIMETRKNAEQTVAAIKRDVEKMKLGLKEDAQKITVDLVRQEKIYNRLKVILIPAAKKFITHANEIYNTTIKDVYSKLAQGGNIAELSKENRKLVVEEKRIHLEIEDKKKGLQVCDEEILRYRELIANIQEEYDYANSLKPDPPREIHKKLSFGLATGIYEKHLAEWNRITQPVRSTHAFYVDTVRHEEETIKRFYQLICEMQNRLEEIERLREDNKTSIQTQGITIKNFEPQLEILEKNIRKISEASKNLMVRGIQEDLIKVQGQENRNESLLTIGFEGISVSSLQGISHKSDSYMNQQEYRMQLKIELLKYTEMAFTGELISGFAGEEKKNLIAEQYGKVRSHLTSKISQYSKLDQMQKERLVDMGSKIFLSILKTQEIKAETSFLMEMNMRLDQEFMVEFEKAVADLKISLENDRQGAKTIDTALNEATTADDLLKASRILDNH
tara:strand:- start:1856 stop:4171 length:2316 start_codon:yes stop_codon:yes gene_type:complete